MAGKVASNVGALLLAVAGTALAQAPWPQIAIPEGIMLTDQGGEVSANGLPLRMRGFTSSAAPAVVAALFRQSLGQPLIENMLGAKLVLGRSHGAHYLTVQLEAHGAGSRGVIAVSELTAPLIASATSRDADQRLLGKLAAGFSIVSRTASDDTRRRAEHVVLNNTHSVGFSTESIKGMLQGDGFTLERDSRPVSQFGTVQGLNEREARMLFFRKPGGEAVAVISRDVKGKTAVVLNTINYLESAK